MRNRTALHRPALLVTLLTVGACAADSRTPTETDLAALAAPQESRSSAECRNVSGALAGNVFVSATVSGDLEGEVVAYAAPIVTEHGPSLHLHTFHLFMLGDGTFMTEDDGVQAPQAPPVYRLNNRYSIIGGSGAYEDASGYLHVHGTLIIDFAGQDPRNGDLDATYSGRVCSTAG